MPQQGGVPETGGTLWRYSFSSASKSGTSMPAGDGWNSTRHACGVLPLAFLLEDADTRRCTRNCFSAGDDRSLMLSTKTGRKGLMPCESLLYSSHSTKKAAMRWTSRGRIPPRFLGEHLVTVRLFVGNLVTVRPFVVEPGSENPRKIILSQAAWPWLFRFQ